MKVFARWYNKVVEGTVVRENDMFGMTVVEIPIQGVKVLTLFKPQHIYESVQEACWEYPVTFPTPETFRHPEINTGKFIVDATEETKKAIEQLTQNSTILTDYEQLQKFKAGHWNHERNMLQLEYWEEYDRMFHAYMRKRYEMMKPQQPVSPVPDDLHSSCSVVKPAEPHRKPYTVTQLTLF